MGRPQKLTKEFLESCGITKITEDGRVFMGDYEKEITIRTKYTRFSNYKAAVFGVYNHDLYIKNYKSKDFETRGCGCKTILLSRAMWAWFYGEVPANMDVDHIDNNSLNNNLDNLQLLTRTENLAKRKGHMNQYEASLKYEQA